MLNEDNKELCIKCMDIHPTNAGVWLLTIEECSELQKEICKLERYGWNPTIEENIKEEIVDVIVMCQQLMLTLGMSTYEVNKRAKSKLERALK